MSLLRNVLWLMPTLMTSWTGRLHAEQQQPQEAQREQPPLAESELVSDEFTPDANASAWGWQLLELPELAMRLVFTPLFPIIAFAEKTRLDRRIEDLITNDDRSRVVLPVFVALTRDGVGGGLLYSHSSLFGAGERLQVYGLIKTNRDRTLSAGYSEKLPALDGRRLGLDLEYEVNHNERYFGVGPDTPEQDLRALEVRDAEATLKLEVGGPNTFFRTGFGSETTLSYRRERLEPGRDPGVKPLGQPGDSVAPPPAFGESVDYGNASLHLSYDQRDITGRTHRGFLGQLVFGASTDVNGKNLNAGKASLGFSYFLPLAPRHRVLVLYVGGAATTPLGEDAEIPLDSLVSLGRSSGLRGYTERRFRDKSGWWSSLEYRYPVYDFQDTGTGLSAALFIDAGSVAPSPRDFFESRVHYAPGVGIRAEFPGIFVLTGHVAFSPEGVEASLGVNEHYELQN